MHDTFSDTRYVVRFSVSENSFAKNDEQTKHVRKIALFLLDIRQVVFFLVKCLSFVVFIKNVPKLKPLMLQYHFYYIGCLHL